MYRVGQVLTALTIALIVLAVVNVLMTAWATVLDARRSSALSRALGVTPGQVTAGLAVAQMLPALGAAILGVPGRPAALQRSEKGRRHLPTGPLVAARRGRPRPLLTGAPADKWMSRSGNGLVRTGAHPVPPDQRETGNCGAWQPLSWQQRVPFLPSAGNLATSSAARAVMLSRRRRSGCPRGR